MKVSRLIVVGVALLLAGGFLAGCGAKQSQTAEVEYQTMDVTRGDISVEVSATGNLVYADREPLAFETSGTVGEVFVEVGDEVKAGDVLATLDTEEWADYVAGLEKTLTTARRQPAQKELDLLQAQINVQSAQDALDAVEETRDAQDKLDAAEAELKLHEAMLQEAIAAAPPDTTSTAAANFWRLQIAADKVKVADARQELNDVLSGSSPAITASVATQIASKKLQVDIAKKRVEDAQLALNDARQALEDAQTALDEAQATSIEVLAPFDGVVTTVNVQERAAVKKGVTAIILADTARFEAEMLINEIDVLKLSTGTEVNIEVEALPGVTFPARVTTIAPVATIQQGVVNYKVKAELATRPVAAPVQTSAAPTAGNAKEALKLLEDGLASAVKSGRITQQQADLLKDRWSPLVAAMTPEQIDQIITRTQQGQTGAGDQLPGIGGRLGLAGQAGNLTQEQLAQLRERFQQGLTTGRQGNGITADTAQLREGLSVTANLVIEQKQNVVLVPNQAVSVKSGKNYVLVQKADGTREEREVTVGLSDFQNTEIVNGLAASEQVAIAKTKGSTSTATSQQQGFGLGGGSGLRIPATR